MEGAQSMAPDGTSRVAWPTQARLALGPDSYGVGGWGFQFAAAPSTAL